MINFCSYHQKEHDDFHWKSWIEKQMPIWVCREGLGEVTSSSEEQSGFVIGTSKKDARVAHWREIKKRVTTHEGEVLSGVKGREYQKKYSKQHLGIDLSKMPDFSKPQYQEVLQNNYEQNKR